MKIKTLSIGKPAKKAGEGGTHIYPLRLHRNVICSIVHSEATCARIPDLEPPAKPASPQQKINFYARAAAKGIGGCDKTSRII